MSRGIACWCEVRLTAELALSVAVAAVQKWVDVLFPESVGLALKESIVVPGSRTLGRLASWTKDADGKDIPEMALNLSLLAETFLQMFASGLGTLALVWATVVLLGGFSTMLARTDFWFITAIVFVEIARIVGHNSGPEAKFFVDVPTAFSQRDSIVGRVTTLPAFIAQAPIGAALACIALSITRLADIARHHYGGPNVIDASNGNLKPALILFYALVLTQGELFFLWFAVARNRWVLAQKLKKYFENTEVIEFMDGIKLMDRYVTVTLDTCIEKGVVSTMNRTLVSFAAELLQSEYSGDHFSAVSVLYVVITREERTMGVVDQICASKQFATRLIQLVSLKSSFDRDTKAYTAEIVAKLARKLHLADIPEATHSITSLLDGRLMDTTAQTGYNVHLPHPVQIQIINNTYSGPKGKPLFVHGLLILCELADDPENCTKIYETPNLVPKIIKPISYGLPKLIGNDRKTIQIVKASLVVVAKLTSGTGETTSKIRSKISKDGRIAENLLWILQKEDRMRSNGDHEMEILALEILTRLSLDDARAGEFIGVLGGQPFYAQDSPLKMPAVRALHALAANHITCQLIIGEHGRKYSLIQQLVNIMTNDENCQDRAATAGLLSRICANSRTDQDRKRLGSVSRALSTVMQAIIAETTNYTKFLKKLKDIDAEATNYAKRLEELRRQADRAEARTQIEIIHKGMQIMSGETECIKRQVNQCDERLKELRAIRDETAVPAKGSRRNIYSFLALAVEICDKLAITEEVLTNVLATFQMDDRAFAQKLMEIVCLILQTHDGADFVCLEIMKTATKLATWMMRTNRSYILYFQKENIVAKLHRAMQAMRDLERDMILTARINEIQAYEPLQWLVENARILVWPSQH